jgi:hypothetical protein
VQPFDNIREQLNQHASIPHAIGQVPCGRGGNDDDNNSIVSMI